MKKFAPTVLRVGVSLVVIWFGIQQILHPEMWTKMLPSWTSIFGVSSINLININGIFEIVFGLALFFGVYTKIVSIIVTLHLLHITFVVGYGAIGVRDFGLTLSALSVFLNGEDDYSLSKFWKNSSVDNANIT